MPDRLPEFRRIGASLQRVCLALYAAEVGIWEWDVKENSITWSLGVDKIFGLAARPADHSAALLIQQIVPEDLAQAKAILQKILNSSSPKPTEFQCRIRRPDGQIRRIEIVGSISEGPDLLLLGTVRDVTETQRHGTESGDTGFLKPLLEHKEQTDEVARKVVKTPDTQFFHAQRLESLGVAASGIAHELKNILTPIILHTQTMQEELEPNHHSQAGLKEVMKSCGRAKDLIQQILTFSRRQESRRQVIDLREVLSEAAGVLRATIPESVAIHLEMGEKVPRILADPDQIHQLLLNLGINAWHAVESVTGVIELSLEGVDLDASAVEVPYGLGPGRYARLSIRDNGHGMSEAVRKRVFEPFFTTKPQGKGTGLGLALVRSIVEHHCGTIFVESTAGQGTVFRIYFPELTTSCSDLLPKSGSEPAK